MKRVFITVSVLLIALFSACDVLSTFLSESPAPNEVTDGRMIVAATSQAKAEEEITAVATTAPTETAIPEITPRIPFNDPETWKVNAWREYSHPYGNTAILGTDETLFVYIISQVPNLSADDFIVFYDETLIEYEIASIDTDNSGRTVIEYYFRQTAPGKSEIKIRSAYEYATQGDNSSCQILTVEGLDPENGRLVYFAPEHGKKYHFDAECPGENSTPTTLYDALHIGLGACKKCAN